MTNVKVVENVAGTLDAIEKRRRAKDEELNHFYSSLNQLLENSKSIRVFAANADSWRIEERLGLFMQVYKLSPLHYEKNPMQFIEDYKILLEEASKGKGVVIIKNVECIPRLLRLNMVRLRKGRVIYTSTRKVYTVGEPLDAYLPYEFDRDTVVIEYPI